MASSKTQPARGMRDFLPGEVRRREYVIGVIKEVYERYGFEPLETPAVENIETLMGKYGEEGNQLIFKILKRGVHEATGEADLALRYDLTVPLARVVAEYRDKLPKFFKRYQIQPVWRADRPARGRFREFYQCDVDILGSRSMLVEAELIAAASDVLVALGFNDFTIRLNHRKILEGQLDAWGVPPNRYSDVLTILDKVEKIGHEGVETELLKKGISQVISGEILASVRLLSDFYLSSSAVDGWNQVVLDDLFGRLDSLDHDAGKNGINELRRITQILTNSHVASHIKIDPSLARGLSYYTGTIMEINVPDLAGSLGGGGRYDNLVGMFSGAPVPACGFSLGLERIIVVMNERGMFEQTLTGSAEVLVASLGEEFVAIAIQLASDLRKAKVRVSVYPDPMAKLKKILSFASQEKMLLVALVGAEEQKQGVVTIRDMTERNEERPRWDIAVSVIRAMLPVAKHTRELDEKMIQELIESGREWLQRDKSDL